MLILFEENTEFITSQFLGLLGVKIKRSNIHEKLQDHPDYPSLLAIKDTLSYFDMDTLAVRLNKNELEDLEIPFISQIQPGQSGGGKFTIVRRTSAENMEYLEPDTKKWRSFHLSEYSNRFLSIALFAEKSQPTNSNTQTDTIKIGNKPARYFQYLLIPTLIMILIGVRLQQGSLYLAELLYYISFAIGTVIGILLLIFQIDQHNPLVKQICSGNSTKGNCDSVLSSSGSSIFGVSWSQIGFCYFIGGLVILTLNIGPQTRYMYLLSILTISASPFIIYSIYYQWKIVRQWCLLCLLVQGVLLAQVILVMWAGWAQNISISITYLLEVIVSFILFYSIIHFISDKLIFYGKEAKDGQKHRHALRRLKSNNVVFNSLLMQRRSCTPPPTNLGITLGNENAENTLIKICNPYCGPCAKAHPEIDNLVRQNQNLKVIILFTASGEPEDPKTRPVQHLLAIASKNDQTQTVKALNDWYLAKNKDYSTFSTKYPLTDNLEQQIQPIKQMYEWCKTNEILFTPTYFLNNVEVPEPYSITELDYILKTYQDKTTC